MTATEVREGWVLAGKLLRLSSSGTAATGPRAAVPAPVRGQGEQRASTSGGSSDRRTIRRASDRSGIGPSAAGAGSRRASSSASRCAAALRRGVRRRRGVWAARPDLVRRSQYARAGLRYRRSVGAAGCRAADVERKFATRVITSPSAPPFRAVAGNGPSAALDSSCRPATIHYVSSPSSRLASDHLSDQVAAGARG
jgi:hypothetical protein